MNINSNREHTGTVLITHKMDATQFATVMHSVNTFLAILGTVFTSDDPAKITALTGKLKASTDVLVAAVEKTEPLT